MSCCSFGADKVVGAFTVLGIDDLRIDRCTAWRKLVNHGDRHLAVEGERQRAGNRCRCHGQEMRPADALGTKQLALTRPEAVLLVDHGQPKAGELDVVLYER